MKTKTPILLCVLFCLSLAALPCVYASDNAPDSVGATGPLLIAARVEDDPFAGDDDDGAVSEAQFPDPIEGFNRSMFTFNDKLYYYLLKPTAMGFAFVLPERARVCLKNCLYNLSMPVRAANCLFQLRGPELGVELWRFIINSTAGIGGLFDPAGSFFYLPTYKEDTGQTFGSYGFGPGFFLMLPVAGPSSGRDATGLVFDIALDPLTYLPVPGLRLVLEPIINTSLNPDEYAKLKAASIDPYIAIRNGFLQYREAAIQR